MIHKTYSLIQYGHAGRLLCGLMLCFCTPVVSAQSVLVTIGSPANQLVSVNLVTCEVTTVISSLNIGNITDFVMAPDGSIYLQGFSGGNSALFRWDPVSGAITFLTAFPQSPLAGSLLLLNDSTIFVHTRNNFFTYNINQNTYNLLATPTFDGFGEMFEYNGNIYIIEHHTSDLYQVIPGPPFELEQINMYTPAFQTSLCNNIFGPPAGLCCALSEYNFSNGTHNVLCANLPFDFVAFSSTAPDLNNPTGPLCDCISESGTFQQTATINACDGAPVPLPHNGDETLDGDDNFVFALVDGNMFVNYPNDVIYQYPGPVATFIPGVTEYNVLYRIYAVAANALGNGVDFNDPCREISNPITIRWRPSPTVTFSVANPNVCAGACTTVTANFTGTAPFTLTYTSPVSGSVTQTFSSNTGTFQVCPAAGAPPGSFSVQATALTDAWCTCN